jgi:hypothetical protein
MSLSASSHMVTNGQVEAVLGYLTKTRHPLRNRVVFLLSVKAGLRAKATQFGDPLSTPSLAYQAVALVRRQAALEKLSELTRAWPEARLDEMLYGIHKNWTNADMKE